MGKGWIIGVALLGALGLGGGAAALPLSVRAQAEMFAECAGRLSAVVEFDFLLPQAAAERAAQQRRAFLDILDAIAPDAAAEGLSAQALSRLRIEARQAHVQLLYITAYSFDATRARYAEATARRIIGACHGLLLG